MGKQVSVDNTKSDDTQNDNKSAEQEKAKVEEQTNDSTNSDDKKLTTEEANEIIAKRVSQEKANLEKKYADYDQLKEVAKEYESQKEQLGNASSELSKTVHERDKLKIALEYGFDDDTLSLLPEEGDYDKLKSHASKLSEVLNKNKTSVSENQKNWLGLDRPKDYSASSNKKTENEDELLQGLADSLFKKQ